MLIPFCALVSTTTTCVSVLSIHPSVRPGLVAVLERDKDSYASSPVVKSMNVSLTLSVTSIKKSITSVL